MFFGALCIIAIRNKNTYSSSLESRKGRELHISILQKPFRCLWCLICLETNSSNIRGLKFNVMAVCYLFSLWPHFHLLEET